MILIMSPRPNIHFNQEDLMFGNWIVIEYIIYVKIDCRAFLSEQHPAELGKVSFFDSFIYFSQTNLLKCRFPT